MSKVPRGFRDVTPDVAAIREKIVGFPSTDLFGERAAKVIGAHIWKRPSFG